MFKFKAVYALLFVGALQGVFVEAKVWHESSEAILQMDPPINVDNGIVTEPAPEPAPAPAGPKK